MKKYNIFTTLVVLAALVGCGNKNSSSSEANQSSPAISNSVPSTSSSTSTTPSSPSTPVEEKYFLNELQEGFIAKSVYSKKYNSGNPSITLVKTYVGNGVAKWEQFSGSSWDNITEGTKPYYIYQYECDENEDAQIATFDTTGNPIYTPLQLKDSISGENVEAFWSETNLDNAFAKFTKDNFTKQEDGTYSLDLSEDALANEEYAGAVSALVRQMYMVLQGSDVSGYYFFDEKLASYVVTVDADEKPISYTAEFEDVLQSDGWGGYDTVSYSLSGTFEKTGNDCVTKLSKFETKYEELDAAFEKLQKQNYAFDVKRDDTSWGTKETITGESDGKGNFIVDYSNKGDWSSSEEHFGYSQTSENTYRKYLRGENSNIWNGEEKEGSALCILPNFLFSSALFDKDEEASTDSVAVYNFERPKLIDSNYSVDKGIIDFGFDSIQGWSLADLSVEVSDTEITFKNNTSATRSMEATFSKIGEVTPISATVSEVSDLLVGTYSATNTIKTNSITFDVVISDGKFVITKDGQEFGTYDFVVNKSNKIELDSAVETNTFVISETTGEGDSATTTNYTCNINKTVAIDDPFNPSKVTFEIKYVQEGKTYGSTIKFAAEKVVPSTF